MGWKAVVSLSAGGRGARSEEWELSVKIQRINAELCPFPHLWLLLNVLQGICHMSDETAGLDTSDTSGHLRNDQNAFPAPTAVSQSLTVPSV